MAGVTYSDTEATCHSGNEQLGAAQPVPQPVLDGWAGRRRRKVYIPDAKHVPSCVLTILMPDSYPSSSPPVAQLHATHLSDDVCQAACAHLQQLWAPGEVVVHTWVEWLKEQRHLFTVGGQPEAALADSHGAMEKEEEEGEEGGWNPESMASHQIESESRLSKRKVTRPAGWKPPAAQVDHCLLRPAWSQQHDQPVWGLMWCPEVAPHISPRPPCSQAATQPAASEPGPSTPLPAKRSKRTEAEQAAEPTQATTGRSKGKAAKPTSASKSQSGRWVDRDCNAALNMQRIGEGKWRPLQLRWLPDNLELPTKRRSTKSWATSGCETVHPRPDSSSGSGSGSNSDSPYSVGSRNTRSRLQIVKQFLPPGAARMVEDVTVYKQGTETPLETFELPANCAEAWEAMTTLYGAGVLKWTNEGRTMTLSKSRPNLPSTGKLEWYQAPSGLVIPAGLVEAVAATLKAYTAPTLKRPKLPSALSNISQTAWDYVQQDFELQMVGLKPNDLPDVKPAPDVPAYQWRDCREDDQKDAYMWHFEAAAQLICANITSSKFKPLAILTDLVDEWHLKYMSGHKLCAGRFPSRAAAVACIRDWLQKEKVIETAETDEPLQVAEVSDPGVLSPILKRARYTYRLPVGGPGEEACLRDLADCLPKEEAYEVLCLAGIC
ncbi:hypothetical protein QJQ45_004444 [Haematococcus lacustris]|nr:hypothetical protein QJQ45_004444 [Haematococcus lacustris]